MPIKNKRAIAKKAMLILRNDRDERLLRIDRYEQGKQDFPYTPDSADAEYLELAKRSITNICQFALNTPSQMLRVDSFRRGRAAEGEDPVKVSAKAGELEPEWVHWQKSRLDARQGPVIYGALKFGHAFTVTEMNEKLETPITRGLSPLQTVALFEDPANDDDPYAALHIKAWPKAGEKLSGRALMWDDTNVYEVKFESIHDLDSIRVGPGKRHGATVCPVTRFAASVDLEGRTTGLIEPMMILQDRLNQTVFDLLIVQSYASQKVRTVSGMAPPVKMKAIDFEGNTIPNPASADPDDIADWVPVIDPDTGRPVIDEIRLNAKRLLFAQDPQTRFDTLDETPLDGFIAAIELAFKHFSALNQIPPHHMLGEIANLSAEALDAAETALSRKVDAFKAQFGESWERVFRIAAEIGEYEGADDFAGEVIWHDSGHASLSQTADALGKMHELLGVPQRALWRWFPGVTANELGQWEELYEEENADLALASRVAAASPNGSTRPPFRLSQQPAEQAA